MKRNPFYCLAHLRTKLCVITTSAPLRFSCFAYSICEIALSAPPHVSAPPLITPLRMYQLFCVLASSSAYASDLTAPLFWRWSFSWFFAYEFWWEWANAGTDFDPSTGQRNAEGLWPLNRSTEPMEMWVCYSVSLSGLDPAFCYLWNVVWNWSSDVDLTE